MKEKLKILRGYKKDLPQLQPGELATTFDTDELFIGSDSGNVRVGGKRDYINVKDYGVKGDGVTDDTENLKKILNAIEETEETVLFFPEGTFLFSDKINLSSNLQIKGVGQEKTFLKQKKEMEALFETNNVKNVTFENLTIEGVGTINNSTRGILCRGSNQNQNIEINKCNFKNIPIGVHTMTYGVTIKNSLFSNIVGAIDTPSQGYGVLCVYGGDIRLYNNNFINVQRHGIYISGGCSRVIIENNFLKDHRGAPIRVNSRLDEGQEACQQILIKNNIIIDVSNDGDPSEVRSGMAITGNIKSIKIKDNFLKNIYNFPIYVLSGEADGNWEDLEIEGNSISQGSSTYEGPSIMVRGASTENKAKNFIITNNYIENSIKEGIVLSRVKDGLVTNNLIRETIGFSIRLYENTSGVIVENNITDQAINNMNTDGENIVKRQIGTMVNSTSDSLEGLRSDFNNLLNNMRAGGLIKPV